MRSGPVLNPACARVWLLAGLLASGYILCDSAAQTLRNRPPVLRPPAPVRRLERPLSRYRLDELPLQRISKEQAIQWRNQAQLAALGRAPAPPPPATTTQFIDLTTNPRPPLVGPSTRCQEIHPSWAWDQQHIYFASNNVDPVGNYGATAPPSNALFHIYRMTSDGAFVQQITGTTIPGEAGGNQLFPAINHSLTKLAYVHRDNPTQPYQLYVLDLTLGTREQLTGIQVANNPLNSEIVNVEHPSWHPGDGVIAFAARNRNVPNDVRNIYVVDVVTRVVRRVTNATPASGVECFDPVFHPGPAVGRICFAANTGNPANGPAINPNTGDLNYIANPLQDLDGDGRANDLDRNLFTVPYQGPRPGAPVIQLTSAPSDDIEPAYNQSDYPPGSVPSAGAFNRWLAFASKGRRSSPGSPPGNTYDIYFNDGSPESVSQPIRLFTPDTNAGAVPLNQSDERYPTWSAGLPPQNPIDRIAFSSNRQNNVADPFRPTVSATDTDIWAAEVTDITPPTLFPIDEVNLPGEVLHIANAPLPNRGRRIGVPGETFYFYARIKDHQYGVDEAWIQIKDPDGPSTDSQGRNHRLYGVGQYPSFSRGPLNNAYVVRRTNDGTGGPTHWLHLPFETDYEGIGVSDYQYFSDPVRLDVASPSRARYASKNPGVDDSVRWSGNQNSLFNPIPTSNRPPLDANGNPRWLRLHDDGIFPDRVAGDDVWSGQWVTPNEPSDFYVDLIVYDKAFNPQNPSEQQNWIVYDNIWGFSTQPFVSRNPVLFVDDYGCGQRWPRGLKGAFRPFPTYRYGTESDIIDRPPQFWPREVRLGPSGAFELFDVDDPDTGIVGTNETYDFLIGAAVQSEFIPWGRGSLRQYRYDIWRVLAKGPVPETVLNNYVPTVEQQPGDITGDPAKIINRPIPRRAVVWSSPYTGDAFLGGGSILDQATQTLLANYRSRAGRLVVAGGDIMWALTVDGTVPQLFVQNTLGANYLGDASPANANPLVGTLIGPDITLDAAGRNFLPYGSPPFWGPDYDPDPLGTAPHYPDASDLQNSNQGNNVARSAAADGTPFQQQDGVEARSGWEQIYSNRMIANEDPTTRSKTVFMSFSLASMGRRYVTDSDTNPLLCLNYRAKISHAMFCWMFSVDLVGQVRNLNGGGPVAGAWVQVYRGAVQPANLVGSAFTRPDGTYTIRGLPVGGWTLRVDNPGFLAFSKFVVNGGHGLDQSRQDVLLTPAAPGSIGGQVLDQDGQPVPGVGIQAVLQASPLYTGQTLFTTTTGPDGRYLFESMPSGDYRVTVDPQQIPTGFTNPVPQFQGLVRVDPAQQGRALDLQGQPTTNIDFRLTGQDGPLTVVVFEQLAGGGRGNPLPGVEITLLDAGTPVPNGTGTTDNAGQVFFPTVPAGPITVTAFKFGYQEVSATVAIPQQNRVELLLPRAQTRDLFGLAKREIDGQPLSAADLPVQLQLLRPSGVPTPLTANVFAPPQTIPGSSPPARFNYRFNRAQEGQFIVALPAGHPRFEAAQVTVNITSTLPNVAPDLLLRGKPGNLRGVVRENLNGVPGSPVPAATVEIVSERGSPGTVVATVTTAADGTWSTASAIASDLYTVRVSKFGYTTAQKTGVFLAGDTDAGTVLLAKSPRGRVYGLVKRSTDQSAIPNVLLEFWTTSVTPPLKVAETTTFDPPVPGPSSDPAPINYSIGSTSPTSALLPIGDYEIRIADSRFQPLTTTVTLTASQATVRKDIVLTPRPGFLSGTVREMLSGGAPGQPIAGAQVTIRPGTVPTLTTDQNGLYRTPARLAPGTYTVTASAFGFVDNSISVVVEGDTTAPDLLLSRVPGSTVSGTVRSSVDNALIGGARVEVLPTDGGNPIATTVSSPTASGTPPANFVLRSVPPGTYLLRATKAGWKTTQQTITVNPGADLTGLTLILQPERVFGRGLLLIALPDDFPGEDAAAVLDQPFSEFKSAYWLTEQDRYAIYPDPAAAEFRLGKGMFVRFNQATAFAKAGIPAPNTDFLLPVKAGWNLIGSVRRIRIEWLRVRVRTAGGPELTMQQAMDQGIVQNGLFGYVDGYFQSNFMDPFSGYFMRAFQDCTLVIPTSNTPPVSAAERARVAARHPVPPVERVAAELHALRLGPPPAEARPVRRGGSWDLDRLIRTLFGTLIDHWPWQPSSG